jgi:hypothetical protein
LFAISGLTIVTSLSAIRLLVQAYHDAGADTTTETATDASENDWSRMHRLWDAIMAMKIVFLFGTFTLLCAWSLTSLLFFHGMIISAAQTTNERVRGVYRFGSVENTADQGCPRNWWNAFCSPWIVSRLPRDFSECVECSYCDDNAETAWAGEVEESSGSEPPPQPTTTTTSDAATHPPAESNGNKVI